MCLNGQENEKISVCILAIQYFDDGKYGGFGRMSRLLAEGLNSRGISVSVIFPKTTPKQQTSSIENGVEVISFNPLNLLQAIRLIRNSHANIFHSQNPTILSYLAQKLRPDAQHIITCRDPKNINDWIIEFRDATIGRKLLTPINYLTESSFLIKKAVQAAAAVFTPAFYLMEKVTCMYHPSKPVQFLPNIIEVCEQSPEKSKHPSVVFIGRLDRRKRPERFLDLAKALPHVEFHILGKAESKIWQRKLQKKINALQNVHYHGFVNVFDQKKQFYKIVGSCWALVNTASREGLPISFMEAAALGCAIVSVVNPDQFASRFGLHLGHTNWSRKLAQFLDDPEDVFRKGSDARNYINENYSRTHAIDEHIRVYKKLLRYHSLDEQPNSTTNRDIHLI